MTKYEKPPGQHDWVVGYIDEDGDIQSMTVFGQDTVDAALKEARYSLGLGPRIVFMGTVEHLLTQEDSDAGGDIAG
jgi:hypothetical protein